VAGRLFDHLGQGFNDLLFGVVDVLQTMDQQVLHRFNILGEDSHILFTMMARERRRAGCSSPSGQAHSEGDMADLLEPVFS
jgi:hypothetical protein